ncbi:class I SAM-dependent DNA methyltransferase [Geotalea uraniireducens]|uniref:site-specific DNA-methyltransferase (adenine-specific) n=1 Tax=Geotalea uraniireducens (strain Rf4) TaxID=351605 RepID=A5GER3_GEOUR|nr:TaqI-like C-terminal specificity domain-containing protein [Geotalea uraniireducens]ABQ25918.1 hypothetical protein Gura_1723 [Geotalea uraniireducens Rf4]
MKLQVLSPAKSLNRAYLKQSLKRDQIELFKANLSRLFDRINEKESEENLKNIVSDFLKDTWYKNGYEVNTKERADLVIHNGKSAADTVGVIVEVKRPANRNEMITPDRPNTKALHELLHYYMQERFIKDNKEIRHLIVCNIFEWYIFDAADFERFFFGNAKLVKSYKDWNDGLLVGANTDWFYQEIAKDFIEKNLTELPCTCFDLKEFERIARNSAKTDDKKLINLYKILSPAHLLKQPFANDSNSLNKEFYGELLHILGLEEVREKGKKLIGRKPVGARNDESLLENTFNLLKSRHRLSAIANPGQFGVSEEEQYFSIALELCITWLNRLLFLKLLEGRLIAYHKGNRDHAFLNSNLISDFDELNELFFEVLAVRIEERSESVRKKFGNIPYLNSSLFEESDLERTTIRINELKNRLDLSIYSSTVLKDGNGRRISGSKSTLHYLFEFLDAYDFATEGSAEIQEQNKTIINASVLGLIFEKINGYKDGSFFTPGFITMYMCRETIRRAVLQKFNDKYGWTCKDFTELYNTLDKIGTKEANEVVNSLKVCDPAVGSGHFLVSALNEIISIKSDLEILADKDGKRVRGNVTIENDELIITRDDQIFAYDYMDAESQRVQETLFHEKETIIENCLFGVDINPKSVMICRLRLWIELLKNAYYRPPSPRPSPTGGEGVIPPPLMGGGKGEGEKRQLETLPNIDINIKCGNSLVSRFALSGNPNIPQVSRKKLKELTDKYRDLVWSYKQSPSNKVQLRKAIENLKHDLESFALPNDRDLAALRKKENELAQLGFAFDKKGTEQRQKLLSEVGALKERFDEKQRSVYANAFEWRLEFPEVLDAEGEFVGFDAIIGNPPYIRQEAIKEMKPALTEMFGSFFCGTADIYTYFYKTGLDVAKPGATLCYIAPNKFMRAGYGKNTRELLTSQAKPLMVLDFGDLPIFEEATTYPSIVMVEKMQAVGAKQASSASPAFGGRASKGEAGKSFASPLQEPQFLAATFTNADQLSRFDEVLPSIGFTMPVSALRSEGWTLERPEVLGLMEKLRKAGKPLGEYVNDKIYRGVLTGLNEAFVIDEETNTKLVAEDPRSAEIIKPWLRGKDIFKWKTKWAGLYVLFTRRGTDIEQYPAIKRHLEQFREDLEPKTSDNNKRGRKPGPYKWFEIQDNIAYFEEFDKAKILWPGISAELTVFSLDEDGYFGNDNNQLIISGDRCLLAILNSKLMGFVLKQICDKVQGGFYRLKIIYIEQLPIPPATDAQKAPIIELVEKILADPASSTVPQFEAEIDRLVYELYGLTEAEIAVVEGAA